MIKLNFRKKENGVPILSKQEIEDLAVGVLGSYKPDLVDKPGVLDMELFIENYAELDMDYQDLTHDSSILGMTVFNDCSIPIYDAKNDKAKRIEVREGTVIIDNSLLLEGKSRRERFTLAHESAHWFLHRQIYLKDNNQINLFDILDKEQKKIPVIKCRTSDIAGGSSRSLNTDNDWLEWQADYMASALLMPKNSFAKIARDKFKSAKISKGFYQIGRSFQMDLWIEGTTRELADIFQVSFAAAKIRLKNLGFIRDENNQEQNLFGDIK